MSALDAVAAFDTEGWVPKEELSSRIRSSAKLSVRKAGGSIARARREELIFARGSYPDVEYRLTAKGIKAKKDGTLQTKTVSAPIPPKAVPVSEPTAVPLEVPHFLRRGRSGDPEEARTILNDLDERASLDAQIAKLKQELYQLESRRQSAHLVTLDERLREFLAHQADKA